MALYWQIFQQETWSSFGFFIYFLYKARMVKRLSLFWGLKYNFCYKGRNQKNYFESGFSFFFWKINSPYYLAKNPNLSNYMIIFRVDVDQNVIFVDFWLKRGSPIELEITA